MSHTFTPEQSEKILNAVDALTASPDNPYYYSRFINDLCAHRLLQLTDENNEAAFTENGFVINTVEFDEISTNNLNFSEFFFKLHEAINQNN